MNVGVDRASLACDWVLGGAALRGLDGKNLVTPTVSAKRHRYARRALPDFPGSSSVDQGCKVSSAPLLR